MIHFVTYGDQRFLKSRNRICQEARDLNIFSSVKAYTPESLSENFKQTHERLLKQKRGGGYWCWKYYVVSETFKSVPENSWVLYADAGCHFIPERKAQIQNYINIMENQGKSMLAFEQTEHKDKDYTKRDMFEFFKIKLDGVIATTGQLLGGIFLVKNNAWTRHIFNLLLYITQHNPALIDDTPSKVVNANFFKDHRHDQSLFSLVRKIFKDQVLFTKDVTYFGPSFIHATRWVG